MGFITEDQKKFPVVATDGILAVIENEGEDIYIAVIERSYSPFGLALPGGKLDVGESLFDGCVREIEEELSLGGGSPQGGFLKNPYLLSYHRTPILIADDPNRDPRHHVMSFAFLFLLEKRIDLVAADDAKNARWMHINDIILNKDKFVCDHFEMIMRVTNRTYMVPKITTTLLWEETIFS
jgi:8-oxo-dGTP diphosphatase